jgi:hypothetical protein
MSLKNKLIYPFIILAIVVSMAGCISLSPQDNGPTIAPTVMPTIVPTEAPATPTPSPITSLPTGTQLVWDLHGGDGQLVINNLVPGQDAVVVMASASDPQAAVLAVYVQGGQSYTVYGISDGQYILYDMLGTDWDNSANVFLNTSEYVKFNGALDYSTTTNTSKVYTVTINPPGTGDTQIQDVDPADIPAIS